MSVEIIGERVVTVEEANGFTVLRAQPPFSEEESLGVPVPTMVTRGDMINIPPCAEMTDGDGFAVLFDRKIKKLSEKARDRYYKEVAAYAGATSVKVVSQAASQVA